jgi:hypothetical protein
MFAEAVVATFVNWDRKALTAALPLMLSELLHSATSSRAAAPALMTSGAVRNTPRRTQGDVLPVPIVHVDVILVSANPL